MVVFTKKEAMEPKRRVRNLPRNVSEIKAPAMDVMLEEPEYMLTTFTSSIPLKLYFVCKYIVKFATKLIDANFSNVSFPSPNVRQYIMQYKLYYILREENENMKG